MTRNTSAPYVGQVINWWMQFTIRSLRVRLALWAFLLLAVLQLILGGALYTALAVWLQNEVDNNLFVTASQVASTLHEEDEPANPVDIEAVNFFADASRATESYLRDQLFFVRLVDRVTGAVIETSADYDLPISASALINNPTYETFTFENDQAQRIDVRVYTLPLIYASTVALQVGVSLEETYEIQSEVLRLLSLSFIVTAVLALLSGWFLANRALSPIRAISRTTAEINETDLTRRLDFGAAEIELGQLVDTFNAMLERIEQAFQRQRRFTADAAHELRTPLAIMQTGLEVTLSRKRAAADYRSALESVYEESQRLSQLANMLLALARADAHEAPLVKQPIHLSQMLNAVVDGFESLARDKNIVIKRVIADDLQVYGDEDRLIQVMFNLIDNAIKYTPLGGSVAVIAKTADGHAQVVISDTGQGIPLADQAHIFDRFYRVDAARNRHQGGFGLGLAIAKQIVELHRGSIRLSSTLGEGTQFVIRLPSV